MIEWLAAPIDPGRVHAVDFGISWHARSMVLAWGIIAPLAVILARFFKVMPGQDWPRVLDNQMWWRGHWMGHALVVGLSIFGLGLVLPSDPADMSLHNWLGYLVLLGAALQILLGVLRGSKGGPTARAPDGSLRGHHYDMTRWRRLFETLHKSIGYLTLGLASFTILLGLWKANGPVWMWLVLIFWWTFLLALSVLLQKTGRAIDTYQAIWGPDPAHPGNRGPAPGWGMRRHAPQEEGEKDVRRHRGNGLRGH